MTRRLPDGNLRVRVFFEGLSDVQILAHLPISFSQLNLNKWIDAHKVWFRKMGSRVQGVKDSSEIHNNYNNLKVLHIVRATRF